MAGSVPDVAVLVSKRESGTLNVLVRKGTLSLRHTSAVPTLSITITLSLANDSSGTESERKK